MGCHQPTNDSDGAGRCPAAADQDSSRNHALRAAVVLPCGRAGVRVESERGLLVTPADFGTRTRTQA
jgi:hypothetical protein